MSLYVAWKKGIAFQGTVIKVSSEESGDEYIAAQHPKIRVFLEVIQKNDGR